jgi:sec-independent protein translocase protein TatA
MGSDLGGAVKGFKDGMKEGGVKPEESTAPVAGQVTASAPVAEKTTIDVEAKTKS